MGYTIEVSFNTIKHPNVTEYEQEIIKIAENMDCNDFYKLYDFENNLYQDRNHIIINVNFDNTTQFTQNTPTASWIIPHTLRTQSPMVQVYDLSYNQIIPNAVIGVDNGTLKIEFLIPTTGYVMISNGGGLNPTGSTAILSQSSAAVTWSFSHNLNQKYPVFQVYGENDEILIPSGIKALSPSGSEIYFATPTTGIAVAEYSGVSGSFIGTVVF